MDIFGTDFSVGLLALAFAAALILALGGRRSDGSNGTMDAIGMTALLAAAVWAFIQVGLLAAIGLFVATLIIMVVLRIGLGLLLRR